MKQVKFFEVRDRGTMIPCFAIQMKPGELPMPLTPTAVDEHTGEVFLMKRAGFDLSYPDVIFGALHCSNGEVSYDPFRWPHSSRTMQTAHSYIRDNWDGLHSGDVIDVEFLLGETVRSKVSERLR